MAHEPQAALRTSPRGSSALCRGGRQPRLGPSRLDRAPAAVPHLMQRVATARHPNLLVELLDDPRKVTQVAAAYAMVDVYERLFRLSWVKLLAYVSRGPTSSRSVRWWNALPTLNGSSGQCSTTGP